MQSQMYDILKLSIIRKDQLPPRRLTQRLHFMCIAKYQLQDFNMSNSKTMSGTIADYSCAASPIVALPVSPWLVE